jgi:hypothetical protein
MSTWDDKPNDYEHAVRVVDWLRAENAKLRAALKSVKELVVGDKIPRWQDDYRTTITRGQIADICDIANDE